MCPQWGTNSADLHSAPMFQGWRTVGTLVESWRTLSGQLPLGAIPCPLDFLHSAPSMRQYLHSAPSFRVGALWEV